MCSDVRQQHLRLVWRRKRLEKRVSTCQRRLSPKQGKRDNDVEDAVCDCAWHPHPCFVDVLGSIFCRPCPAFRTERLSGSRQRSPAAPSGQPRISRALTRRRRMQRLLGGLSLLSSTCGRWPKVLVYEPISKLVPRIQTLLQGNQLASAWIVAGTVPLSMGVNRANNTIPKVQGGIDRLLGPDTHCPLRLGAGSLLVIDHERKHFRARPCQKGAGIDVAWRIDTFTTFT